MMVDLQVDVMSYEWHEKEQWSYSGITSIIRDYSQHGGLERGHIIINSKWDSKD